MPDCTFELTASLHLTSDGYEFTDANGVRDLLARLVPDAIVDFRRGRLHVEQHLEYLRRLGAPEVILQGDAASLDRTICVEVPIMDFDSKLVGYTTGFGSYDGCIDFNCVPFSIDALKAGSLAFANALSLDLSLSSQDGLEVGMLAIPKRMTAKDIVKEKFADLALVDEDKKIEGDWRDLLRPACETWLSKHPESRTKSRWENAIPEGESLYSCLCKRIETFGTVNRSSRIVFDRAFWHHCLRLEFGDWTALVNLSGHPGPLLTRG